MANENGTTTEVEVTAKSLRVRGRDSLSVAIFLVVVLLLGAHIVLTQRTLADDRRANHEDIETVKSAIESLVWVGLPKEYRDRMAPPLWIRRQLEAAEAERRDLDLPPRPQKATP